MAKLNRFEDLNAWQEARNLARMVFELCSKSKREFSLCDQIKRSAISVMANLAEGFGRFSVKDAKHFYTTARGSLAETQSHLYVFKDAGLIDDSCFDLLYEKSIVVNKLINGLISNAVNRMSPDVMDKKV